MSEKGSARAGFYHLSFQEFLAAEQLARLNDGEDKLLAVFRQRAEQANWRPTLKFLFARRVAEPGWRAGLQLLEKMLTAIDVGSLGQSLGLALSAVDAVETLLSRNLKLQEGLLDQLRQIGLAAIQQDVELKARVELTRMLGRIGDPRVVDDLSDPAAWAEVAAGTYRVGDQKLAKEIENSWGKDAVLPDATIHFEQPFRLSKYPVTNLPFARFVAAGGYDKKSLWHDDGWKWREANSVVEPVYWQNSKWNGRTQPIVGVSWWEADAFCRWAGCRLPTEREWEAAARGPQGWAYPWDNDWREGICNSNEANLGVTTPAGIFPRSAAVCGAHDMAGNVWEWCGDTFDPAQEDAPAAGRVLRGGSWYVPSGYCRSAVRGRLPPDYRVIIPIGFRAART